jgi:phospholipid/cholesterol/gamma-HCH transport system substrate-binding protein
MRDDMTERAMRRWIGLFVLVALILLSTLIVAFGSLPALFKRVDTYYIRFTDAPGIAQGTPVRRSGVRIGEVTDISLDNETGEVHVTIGIEKRYTIRRNEDPTLITGFLGTDASVDFIPRQVPEGQPPPDRSRVPPGTEMAGIRTVSVNTLISRASEVVPTTQETLNDMRKSLQKLEKMTPLMEDTLRVYRDLGQDMRGVVPDLNKTNREIGELAKVARETVPELQKTNTEVQKLLKSANEAFPDWRKTADDIGSTTRIWGQVGERVNVLLATNRDELDRGIKELVKAIDRLNDLLTRGTTLLNDENVKNVSATIKNVREGSDRLPSMARNADKLLEESRPMLRRLDTTLQRAEEFMSSVQQVTKPLSERGGSVAKNLDESLDKLNRTLGDVRALIQAVGESNGTVSRLLRDPSLYNHLDDAIVMVVKTLPRLDRILKDIETFADKLARHPESIGLGGVVKPGSGLKDAPASSSHYPPPTGQK